MSSQHTASSSRPVHSSSSTPTGTGSSQPINPSPSIPAEGSQSQQLAPESDQPANDPNPNPVIDLLDDEVEQRSSSISVKRKHTSVVWDHFEKKKIGDEDKAICNYCKKKLGGGSKNGTRHLHAHLKTCPRRRLVDMRQKVLVTNFNRAEGKVQVNNYTFDQDSARRELVSMIIAHEYPLSIVDHRWFRRYSCALQPLFKVPSRNTIKSDVMKIFEEERAAAKKLFEGIQSRIAVTTDMWTSSNQKKGFMAITAHYIDDSWILQSRIIRFVYVPCPHTKEVLCEVLFQTLINWNIDSKLSTVTVDNCSSNDAMMELLSDKLTPDKLILGGTLIHMRCCAHILNLVVKDGLDVIKRGIEKIQDSVVYWRGTPKREEKFEETARQLKITVTKKLTLDCSTRWNSTFLMLQTALPYKNVFIRLKQRDSQYKSLPTEEEWKWARDICEKLKIFYEVTELFSGTKYPTANLYFRNLCDIRVALSEWLRSPDQMIQQMAKNMTDKFDKYWTVIHGIMGVAAVLDPRYKMSLLEFYFPILYGGEVEGQYQIDRVHKLCSDLLNEYQFLSASHDPLGTSSSSTPSQLGDLQTCGVTNIMSQKFEEFLRKKKKTSNAKSELDHYLEDDVLPNSPDFDILAWWKVSGVRYPTLRLIARDILAIPVSTVASDSAFSTSGRLVSPNRSRLHVMTVEALMCAQNWLWANEMQGELHDYATAYEDEVHEEDNGEECIGSVGAGTSSDISLQDWD